jgi:hypothetical protein
VDRALGEWKIFQRPGGVNAMERQRRNRHFPEEILFDAKGLLHGAILPESVKHVTSVLASVAV